MLMRRSIRNFNPPPLPSGYLNTWKLVPSNSCPRNLLLSHSLAKMKSLTPFKIKHVYSNGKTWRFLFTPPQPRKVQIYHSPGTNDSKIPMGCPGKGECWGFELINALFLCLAFAPLHALPFWKHLCVRYETRHSLRLELIKALTYERRTQFELVTIFKLKKKTTYMVPTPLPYPYLTATEK